MIEYIAPCAATKEIVWLKQLSGIFNINLTKLILIHSLYQSTIRLVKNTKFHNRSKHVDILYHFILDQFQHVEYIPTSLQIADIFTNTW